MQSEIMTELKEIRKDLDYIKKHLADSDLVLTDDDIESIREADKNLAEKKTKRLV